MTPSTTTRAWWSGALRAIAVTTDVGTDLFCAAEDRDALRGALDFPDGDEAAAEIVRVEHGRPRYGVDLDDSVIPQEAGLNERAVSFTKGCYVGQETVARLHYRGKPNRRLLGLRLSEPAPPGTELRLGEKVVGELGSVVVSPEHGPIGLALIRREAAVGRHGRGRRRHRAHRAMSRSRARVGFTRRPGPEGSCRWPLT